MMENKLWMRLCALPLLPLLLLLLVNAGSADHADDHTATPAPATPRSPITDKVAPGSSASVSLPESSLNQTRPAADASALNGSDTNPRSNDTVAPDGEIPSVTAQPKKYNDSSTVASILENNKNETDDSRLQPHPAENDTHTTQVPSTSSSSSPHTTHATTGSTAPPSNTSDHSAAVPTDSKKDSATSSPTQLPPRTNPAPTNTTTSAHSSTTTTSSSSSKEPHDSQPTTPTVTSSTMHTDKHPEVTEAHPKTTVTPLSSSSARTKASDTPSQLNLGGDSTTTKQESPTLDPLLACLVTAFIITAIVITLLLFLKLRRRDNRPEFRRLQDLPMDDMMEDTPLSMYSY